MITVPVAPSVTLNSMTDISPALPAVTVTLILESNLEAVKVSVVLLALWVALPANEAVTVYVIAETLSIVLVSTPLTVTITGASAPFTLTLTAADSPATNGETSISILESARALTLIDDSVDEFLYLSSPE